MTRQEAARIITVILDCCKGKEEDYEEHEIIPLEKSFKALGMAIEALEQEPKRGYWLEAKEEDPCWYRCSECGRLYDLDENYCPNCGARMEGNEE